tara:strand:+ start:658 stop:1716 length:1059 start_codon:yes stop_codon:yes gene_type:complete
MNSFQINNNYYITYGIKHNLKRQIFLNYKGPEGKRCFWTLIDDTRYGKREPHFLIKEVFWLFEKVLSNPDNFPETHYRHPITILIKKSKILWIFTHICGRPFTQNLVDKFQEISSINILNTENKLVWNNPIEQKIWVKPLEIDKIACLDDPIPFNVNEPIKYQGNSYIEMDAPIGYLEEINWINYDEEKYEISSIENQLDEIEEEEAIKTQKLYTPHRDALIITTLDPNNKIELMYYREISNCDNSIPNLDLGWIEPNVEIIYKPQDYDLMKEPLTKLQESITVEINPGYNFESKDNLYKIDGVLWQNDTDKGWICVDERLINCTMYSIRDFRYTNHLNYYLLTELTRSMNF